LFRQVEMSDEALALYKKAVELAPDAAQYREYLGEYYHSLKRSDEALATWRAIAEGKNKNAKNLGRLAEVLAGFGYLKEGAAVLPEGCALEKDDYNLQLKYADLLFQVERFDDALQQLAAAERLAGNAEEAEAALQLRIKTYQATDKLPEEIAKLQADLS